MLPLILLSGGRYRTRHMWHGRLQAPVTSTCKEVGSAGIGLPAMPKTLRQTSPVRRRIAATRAGAHERRPTDGAERIICHVANEAITAANCSTGSVGPRSGKL